MKTIIANFKSNKNREEMTSWIQQFSTHNSQLSIILCPPFSHLSLFTKVTSQENMSLGVQDLSAYPAGAYTGAESTRNLDGYGVTHAILGHSERRRYFHETVTDVANKIREALSANLTPIVCVTKDELNLQANALESAERKQCLVAFEPIEHIGTGTSDTLADILETKQWVKTAFGDVPYIYGGSVNPSTDPTILQSPEIDGFLVGSACLDTDEFLDLILKIKN